jgi:hypothetical protein
VIFSLLWLFSFRHRRRNHQARERILADLEADLEAGVVLQEETAIDGVKRFQDPEHRAKLYLLRLTDGRVRAVHDLAGSSLADGSREGALGPRLRERVSIVLYPRSGRALLSYSGERIKLPPFVELKGDPSNWPEDDTWTTIPWGDAEAILGGLQGQS